MGCSDELIEIEGAAKGSLPFKSLQVADDAMAMFAGSDPLPKRRTAGDSRPLATDAPALASNDGGHTPHTLEADGIGVAGAQSRQGVTLVDPALAIKVEGSS